MADTKPSQNGNGGFGHIYFDDWKIGASYERYLKKEKQVIDLGKAVAKELYGAPQDPDIKITFQRADGTIYKHVMEFDYSYRKVNDS